MSDRYIISATGSYGKPLDAAREHKAYGIFDRQLQRFVDSFATMKGAEDALERYNAEERRDMDEPETAAMYEADNDGHALASLIEELTNDASGVTVDECRAVVAWCREWVADCYEPGDEPEHFAPVPDADILRVSHANIDGGLAFVLADVRRLAREVIGGMDPSDDAFAPVRSQFSGEEDEATVSDDDFPAYVEAVRERSAFDTQLDSFADRQASATYADAIKRAEALGREHGANAGSWVIDGNTSADDARRIVQGMEDGDPAVLDMLPGSPLSGKWADGMTPREVLAAVGVIDDDGEPDANDAIQRAIDAHDDVLAAYEQGYADAVAETVERDARAMLGDGS